MENEEYINKWSGFLGMPSSEPTECMYHGDRAGFAVLTRELKRNRVLPKPYLTRLASAVCSCRKCSKSSYKYVQLFHACSCRKCIAKSSYKYVVVSRQFLSVEEKLPEKRKTLNI